MLKQAFQGVLQKNTGDVPLEQNLKNNSMFESIFPPYFLSKNIQTFF